MIYCFKEIYDRKNKGVLNCKDLTFKSKSPLF